MAMLNWQRPLRALFGHGYDLLARAGRFLTGLPWRRSAAFVTACCVAGFLGALLRPYLWPAGPTPSGPPAAPATQAPEATPPPVTAPPAPATTAKQPVAAVPEERLTAATDFALPLAGRVEGGYGWRRDPVLGDYRFHPGLDLVGRPGQPVAAAAAGKVASVAAAGTDWGREPAGWEVQLTHSGGWTTRYRFSGEVAVRVGEAVRRGQRLGLLAPPAQLHFGLYRDDRAERPPGAALPEG